MKVGSGRNTGKGVKFSPQIVRKLKTTTATKTHPHKCMNVITFLFFFFLTSPEACGSSQARDWDHASQLPEPQQWGHQILNPLCHKRTSESMNIIWRYRNSYLKISSSFFFFFFCWGLFSGPHQWHMEVPQARGQIGAIATGLHHNPSNLSSEWCLRPTPQLMATPDP